MIDLELILRFLAMNTTEVYNSDATYISLKQLLNREMATHIEDSIYLSKAKENFEKVIGFVYDNFGEEAFYNLQKDLVKIRKRLYPTVYDSLMIATSIALRRGYSLDDGVKLSDKRMELLRNEQYRESITQGTMQVEHIRTRISLALSVIYGMEL